MAAVKEREADENLKGPGVVMVGGMDDHVETEVEIDDEGKTTEKETKKPGVVANVEPNERERLAQTEELEEDARLAYDDSGEGDFQPRQGQGTSRRQRRNQARREAMSGKDQTIAQLLGKVDELSTQVRTLSQNQQGITLSTIDQELRNAQQALSLTDAELAKAVSEGNGERYRQIITLRDEATARVWQLNSIKNRLENDVRTTRTAPQERQDQQDQRRDPQNQRIEQVDEDAQRHMEKFLSRFPYFDLNSADADSLQIKAIDASVAAEGYLPRTPLYWRTLEKRLAERGFMPEAASRQDDQDDEQYQRRETSRRNNDSSNGSGGRPPTASGRGSGRSNGGGFKLHPHMREYLENEGLLYEEGLDEQRKGRRSRLLKQWQENTKKQERGEFDRR